jgi:hypothetical protein
MANVRILDLWRRSRSRTSLPRIRWNCCSADVPPRLKTVGAQDELYQSGLNG